MSYQSIPIFGNSFGDHHSLHSLSQIPPRSLADAPEKWSDSIFWSFSRCGGRMSPGSCCCFALLSLVKQLLQCTKLTRNGAAVSSWVFFAASLFSSGFAHLCPGLWVLLVPNRPCSQHKLPEQKRRSWSPTGGSEPGHNQTDILYKFLRAFEVHILFSTLLPAQWIK